MFKKEVITRRVSLVGSLALLLILVFTFSNRVADFTRLSEQEKIESARISELLTTKSSLSEKIVFATSEAAVEQWAREEGRMVQPGDYLVVPLNPEGRISQIDKVADEEISDLNNWRVWINWLFNYGP